nr:MAG TPA: MORN repeat variant [Caudoviricetes sp.]
MKTKKFYDDNGKLVKERVYGKTPSGGDYSEICYIGNNRMVIRECKEDGTLIAETWGER